MLAAHVGVVRAAVGADGDGQRRIFRVDVIAIQRGVGFERGQDGAHQRRVAEHFRRDALQAAQFFEEGFARRRGRRHVMAAKLRRARAGGDQHARAGDATRRRSSRASSKATTAPMLWPKNAKGRSR